KLKTSLQIGDTPAIDPVHKGLRLILSGPFGLVFDVTIPKGGFDPSARAGWVADARGWSYKNTGDKIPRQAAIRGSTLRHQGVFANEFQLVVTGRGGDLRAAVGQPALDLTVVIDTPVATTGQCAETHYITQGDSSDCRLLNSGQRLECRTKS